MTNYIYGDTTEATKYLSTVEHYKNELVRTFGKSNKNQSYWRQLSDTAKVHLRLINGKPFAYIYVEAGGVKITYPDRFSDFLNNPTFYYRLGRFIHSSYDKKTSTNIKRAGGNNITALFRNAFDYNQGYWINSDYKKCISWWNTDVYLNGNRLVVDVITKEGINLHGRDLLCASFKNNQIRLVTANNVKDFHGYIVDVLDVKVNTYIITMVSNGVAQVVDEFEHTLFLKSLTKILGVVQNWCITGSGNKIILHGQHYNTLKYEEQFLIYDFLDDFSEFTETCVVLDTVEHGGNSINTLIPYGEGVLFESRKTYYDDMSVNGDTGAWEHTGSYSRFIQFIEQIKKLSNGIISDIETSLEVNRTYTYSTEWGVSYVDDKPYYYLIFINIDRDFKVYQVSSSSATRILFIFKGVKYFADELTATVSVSDPTDSDYGAIRFAYDGRTFIFCNKTYSVVIDMSEKAFKSSESLAYIKYNYRLDRDGTNILTPNLPLSVI